MVAGVHGVDGVSAARLAAKENKDDLGENVLIIQGDDLGNFKRLF